ncbi:MAG: endo-1,4-beta-xylanase [Bacteroidota bacterium]
MQKIYLLIALSFLSWNLVGQDLYHTTLMESFQTEYGLPEGQWLFYNNEKEIIDNAGNYGGAFSRNASVGTAFSELVNAQINNAGANPWDAGWSIRNRQKIDAGDKVLFILSLRAPAGSGKVNIFAENSSTFAKEVILTVDLSESWINYLIPFEATSTFNAQSITFGLHLAHQAQAVEIGGFTAINFGGSIELSDLPDQKNTEKYGGFEADAPWRAVAAENIERLRKADLEIIIKDSNGNLIDDVEVKVNMLEHEFAFGSAITAHQIAGNNNHNLIYEDKIINLDGNGHGFNWVVFENDLKWPAWEDEWLVNRSELINAITWLTERGKKIRGHTLVWPGASNMPSDISANRNDLNYIKNRVDQHLEEVLGHPNIKGIIPEWDALNEITTNRSLEQYFKGEAGYETGREILADIFKKSKEVDPEVGLWLNDYVTLSQNTKPGNTNYDNLKLFTQELIDAGVEIEGIGFQGHIGGSPNGIPSILETLDDFYNEFGLKAKITEFDMPSFVEEELAGNYLRDFITAIFSHESMNGFLFWNFWDGSTWQNGGTNLFRQDWSKTPSYDTFVGLVFNEWWNDTTLISANGGIAKTRVFKGTHEISYESNGILIKDTIKVAQQVSLEIVVENQVTSISNPATSSIHFEVFPNPAIDEVRIKGSEVDKATINVFDSKGALIMNKIMTQDRMTLDISHLSGNYFLEIISEKGKETHQISIH